MKNTILLFLAMLCTGLVATAQIGKKLNAQQSSNNIEGTWVCKTGNQTMTLLLLANNTGEFDGEAITYKTAGNKLTIKANSTSTVYTYQLAGLNLTLSGGDLDKAVTFKKSGSESNTAAEGKNNESTTKEKSGDPALIGTWSGQGIEITFSSATKLLFNGQSYNYKASNNKIVCTAADGELTYGYEINQNHLMLNYNGAVLMLVKKNGTATNKENTEPSSAKSTGSKGLIGTWVGNNDESTFMENGQVTINGQTINYKATATTITFITQQGEVTMPYTLAGDKLTVVQNGTSSDYYRKGSSAAANATKGGSIDQSMVGKWARMGGGSSGGGSYSYEQYFILKADGTYEYYGESGRNVSGTDAGGNEVFNGGTASDNRDRGTWSVKGNFIIANSQTKGVQQIPFAKKNNKNNEPVIVLNGVEYVTFYKKAPWPAY